MSQWWILFMLGFGTGLALQIAFPVWTLDTRWLAAPFGPIRQAKSFLSGVWKDGANLLILAILAALMLIILVSGSF
jgi:hypothetical protein